MKKLDFFTKIDKSKQDNVVDKGANQVESEAVKLTSSKLASKYKIKTADLMEKLVLLEFVIKDKMANITLQKKVF